MASSQRLSTAVSQTIKPSSVPYICASCRLRSQIPSRSRNSQQIRHSSDIPFTEKLRRKIWGTDNPPGLKDPYGGPSFLERRLAQRKQEREMVDEAQPVEIVEEVAETESSPQTSRIDRVQRPSRAEVKESAPPEPYKEAETWEGLDWIGHRGRYTHMEESTADEYTPWIKPTRDNPTQKLIWNALHESIFDATQPAEDPYDSEFQFSIGENGEVASGSTAETSDGTATTSLANARVNFVNPDTFKILKNFQFLTSIRLSDPFLNTLAHRRPHTTWSDFVTALREHQKAKAETKLNDHLVADKDLMTLPNVKVLGRKLRPRDKEEPLGRWKVITRELKERGLDKSDIQRSRSGSRGAKALTD